MWIRLRLCASIRTFFFAKRKDAARRIYPAGQFSTYLDRIPENVNGAVRSMAMAPHAETLSEIAHRFAISLKMDLNSTLSPKRFCDGQREPLLIRVVPEICCPHREIYKSEENRIPIVRQISR